MKIVFAGTPEFAVPTLRALHSAGHEISLVVTQPDRPRGRGLKLTSPAVKVAAEELGLPVEQPEKLRDEPGHRILTTHIPDAVIIVAYGEIIPGDLLSIPRYGWINLHASLLPKYRGAAPIQWALMSGEEVTGVTTIQIDEGMDSGPVLLCAEIPIKETDTTPTLSEKLSRTGAGLMVQTIGMAASGKLKPEAQDHSAATKAPLLKKKHGLLDWNLAAGELHNRVRGLQPWPVAHTFFRGQRLRIWRSNLSSPPPGWKTSLADQPGKLLETKQEGRIRVHVVCGQGAWLQLEEVQLAGHKRVSAADFANGVHLKSGERFEASLKDISTE